MVVVTPRILAWTSALVPLALFGFALNTVLSPEIPQWAQPPAEAPPPPPLVYLPLEVPLRAGPKGGTSMVEVGVSFSVQLAPMDLLAVSDQVKKRQDAVLAAMTEVLLDQTSIDLDPVRLHRDLPDPLRDVVNATLDLEQFPEPVTEVLITALQVQ